MASRNCEKRGETHPLIKDFLSLRKRFEMGTASLLLPLLSLYHLFLFCLNSKHDTNSFCHMQSVSVLSHPTDHLMTREATCRDEKRRDFSRIFSPDIKRKEERRSPVAGDSLKRKKTQDTLIGRTKMDKDGQAKCSLLSFSPFDMHSCQRRSAVHEIGFLSLLAHFSFYVNFSFFHIDSFD